MNFSNIKISNEIESPADFDFYFDSIYETIAQLKEDYPEFYSWYYTKVRDGILNGNREIIFSVAQDRIAGVAILKKDQKEKKICTLRVFTQFQHNGIGKKLVLESFDFLNTYKPLITVSSDRDYQFQRLFNYFGFRKSLELPNYYSYGKKEFSYNGILEP
jgi:ribosomal protein S18 acetylase RimI-like enzyme